MLRVAVVGNSGAGKTTVARAIAARLGIEHVELDGIFHQPGWQELAPDEFRARVANRLDDAPQGWVTCGNYSAVTETVWSRADTIVWLDLPRRIVMDRVTRRTVRRVLRREELWNGNREPWANLYRWDPTRNIIRWAWTQHTKYARRYAAAMHDPRRADLRFVRLRRPADVDAWLETLRPCAEVEVHGRAAQAPGPGPCVAIITAMPSELSPVIAQFGLRREWLHDRAIQHGFVWRPEPITGAPERLEVVACSTGVGMDAAGATTEWLLSNVGVDHVIVVGVAGGLGAGGARASGVADGEGGGVVGNVVHPVEVIDHDAGHRYEATPLAGRPAVGRLASSAVFSNDPAGHDLLRAAGALAIDMETAAIAAVCTRHERPWSALRGISDLVGDADDAVMDLLDADGAPDLRAVGRLLLVHPGRVPQLVRLGRGANAATRAAARAAYDACLVHPFTPTP